MSLPQAHFETRSSTSPGFIGEFVTFVVIVVEAARDWVASLWIPTVPTSETTQVKDGSKQTSVSPLQEADSSTTPNVVSGPVEEPNPLSDTGALGNTEDPSVLPPIDSASSPAHNLDDTHPIKAEESIDEVPLVQDSTEPTADIHETALANSSSQEWVSVPKPDAESLSSINPSDVHPEAPTDSLEPIQDNGPQTEESPSQEPESTLESTLTSNPTIPNEVTTTNESDITSPPLSIPEPSLDTAAIPIPTDADVPLNPESNVKVPVTELEARKSNPSLSDSSSINRSAAELPITKKKLGGSFIKKQTTLMTKVFKSKDGPANLTSPSKNSLTIDNQSITSSFVAEPDSMSQSSPAPDAPKFTSPSRVSIGSISSMSGSIKKKFRKNSLAAVSTSDQESRSDVSEVSSSTSQPSKVAEPSLLKTMFKVRKPTN